jgi:hypothetical protein
MQIMVLDVAIIKSASTISGPMGVLAGCVVSCMCSYRAAAVRVQVLEGLPQPVGRQIHLQKKESTEQNKNKPHSILEFRSRKNKIVKLAAGFLNCVSPPYPGRSSGTRHWRASRCRPRRTLQRRFSSPESSRPAPTANIQTTILHK